MESTRAVVFDVGSDSIRAGHAGEAGPTYTTPTLVNMMTQQNSTTHPTSGFVGSDASVDDDAPRVSPVRNGVITHWEAMERLWEGAFRQLNAPSEKHAVLLSDPPLLGPRTQREKLAEVMFETFCVPGLHVENQSVLSVYSSGRTSGLVVGSGTGCSYATPVHEGVYLPLATCRADYAGNSLDLFLRTLLRESGREISEDRRVVTDIKEKCYVSADIHTESLKIHNPVEHVLPDGRKLKLGKERFLVPEALFQPSEMGSREPGLATLVMNCLNMCEVDVKQAVRGHVLLCGGSTLFPGLPERLQSELTYVGGGGRGEGGGGVQVVATEERRNAVWIGGSILAALKSFQSKWMRREEYQERGAQAVYQAFI